MDELEKIGARAVCAEEACPCDEGCELGKRTFRAALRAIEGVGYVVVPKKPTDDMLSAGELGLDSDCKMECSEARVWEHMIAAAQKDT